MARSQRRAGVILGYANIIVKNIVNLLYTPMLLAFVGQGDYGVFQTANSFVFSLTLLSFGFSGAYVRFYTQFQAKDDEHGIRTLNAMYLLLYLGICIVVVGIGLFLAANVDIVFAASFTASEVELAGTLMAIMSFNIAVTLLSTVFDANVIVHEEFTFQQTRQMFTTLATPGLAFVLLLCGFETVGVAYAQLSVNLLLLGLNAWFVIIKLKMRFDFRRFDTKLLRAVAVFSAWIFANQVCDLVNENVPNIILGAECGASIVAVFAVSVQIRHVFISLSTTMSKVFVPQVNRIVAENNDNTKLTLLMTRIGRYQAVVFFWVYGGFAVLGKWFIEIWAGPSFSDAYLLIVVMAAPLFIPLTQNVGIEIQRAKNMHKARSIAYLGFAAVNLALTWFLAPQFGYWAPVVGYDAFVVLGNGLFMNWYYQKRVGLDMFFFWKKVLPIMVACVVAIFVCFLGTSFIPVSGILQFLIWGAAYTLIFTVCVLLAAFDKSERKKLLERLHIARNKNRGKERG